MTFGIDPTPSKAVRASLKAIWRDFKRCADRYAPLYHELFQPCDTDEQHQDDGLSICAAFRDANKDRFAAPWDEWHATEDGQLFGRFTGAAEGLDEFRRLAESGYLAVRELGLGWPDYSYQGWLMLIHEMANSYPTPLLRSELRHWGLEHLADTDYDDHVFDLTEKWAEPTDGSVSYPLHPFHWTLKGNLFTASMSAIELILDAGKALLVGDHIDDFPVVFTHREAKAGAADAGDVILPDVTSFTSPNDIDVTYGPLSLRYRHELRRWHVTFITNGEPEEGWFDDHKGFHFYAVLLRHPHPTESLAYWLIEVEAGVRSWPDAAEIELLEAQPSAEELMGPEARQAFRKEIQRMESELAEIESAMSTCENPERQQELAQQKARIEQEYDVLRRHLHVSQVYGKRSRVIPSDAVKRATTIQSYLSKARALLENNQMPLGAQYLKRTVHRRGIGLEFMPPKTT